MNKNGNKIWTAKNAFSVTLLFLALALIFLAPKAAVNVDEQLHYPHAKKVVNWYFTGGKDQSCLHTPHTNLKHYGQSPDNLTALVNKIFHIEHEFLTRHFTGAVFFWLLLMFSGILTQRITGSWLTAILCILSLAFMPRLSGQAFGNLKDIPFAAGYVAGLTGMVQFLKEMPRPRWKTALSLGLAIAFTISVRAGGYVLLAYFIPGLIVYLGIISSDRQKIITTKSIRTRILLQVSAVIAIAWFAGILFWPFALQNPLTHPPVSLRMMEHYQVSIRQVFEGRLLWSTELPWHYLPKWILISTPLYLLAGFLLFLWFFFKKIISGEQISRQRFLEGVVLFATVFPFLYVMAIGSNLYSGVRQMLFIFPSMALLAVMAIHQLIRKVGKMHKKAAYGLLVLFLLAIIWQGKHQITTFPVDYVYFNVLAGGNKKAWSHYEYDYYFHGVKKPVEYLTAQIGEEEAVIAMNCNLSNYFDHHENIDYQYSRFLERSSYDWDYAILGINYIHPHLLKNNLWKPNETIKTFYHKGNPVAVVLKRQDKNDFYGISEIKNGNLQRGIQILKRAVEKDTTNVWLFANLAKAKLAAGDIPGFEYYVEQGKKIHPFYEPLLMLEATRYFEQKRYRESLLKVNALLDINSRYLPARQLLDDLKMKRP